MNRSLRTTLMLSYLGIAVVTAALIYGITQYSVTRRLARELLSTDLQEIHDEVLLWYETEPNWDGFEQYYLSLHPEDGAEFVQGNRTQQRVATLQHGVVDHERRALVVYQQYAIGDILPQALMTQALPVMAAGETIAWVVPDELALGNYELRQRLYVENTNFVLGWASVAAVLIALLIGWLLSKRILKPITALTEASEAMASGALEQAVPVSSRDEIGVLASRFNAMSLQVATSDQQRRDLTAAIAHDLSTPLHVVSGYTEIIQDNIASATPETLSIMASELEQLRRLVEDLDTLALTDTNQLSLNLEPVHLDEYLPQIVATYQTLAEANDVSLAYQQSSAEQLPTVLVDRDRLTQILQNLLSNSVRHTPSGGNIYLGLDFQTRDSCLGIYVEDNGSGILPEDLPFIFNRFYQADKSRSQNGKMGLGLSISKGLVEAMGGKISASSKGPNLGAIFTISLPLA